MASREYNSANAHPPKREDFSHEIKAALQPEHFIWGPAPILQRNNGEPIMARLPAIPDPYDDCPIQLMPCELEARGAGVPKKARKRRRKKQPARRLRVRTRSPMPSARLQPRPRLPRPVNRPPTVPLEVRENIYRGLRVRTRSPMASAHLQPRPRLPRPVNRLLTVPLEVRENIYRYLLVAKRWIPVRKGWQRVFARKRPCLETAILRVSRQINLEATRVLYGENQFLSRVALPPNRVVDVEALAHIDEPLGPVDEEEDDDDGDNDSDSDFEPIAAEMRQAEKSDAIDVEKYGCLFRQLVVKVDCCLPEVMREPMIGEALDVFTSHPAVWAELTCEENDGHTLGFVLRYNHSVTARF